MTKAECKCDNCSEFEETLFPIIIKGENKYFCKSCYHLYLDQ